ncbi:MAG: hypothetical protein E7609_05295 [Ruminococcaceae bacterium]|nr:hypothetical protein [Oscillospiraceae bacterium]
MRAHTSISLKDRKQLTLNNFRGVDFSSSVTQAAGARATKMRNLINRGGVNRKRSGWNEILQIEGNPRPHINGVFEYADDTLIIHAGTSFYRATKVNGKYTCEDITKSCTYKGAEIEKSALKDQRSQAFLASNCLYIVGCGDFLVYGTWKGRRELRRVAENVDTRVPVTARIYPNDALTPGKIEALESANLLTGRRKNVLFGTDDKELAGYDEDPDKPIWVWTLDSVPKGRIESMTVDRIEEEKEEVLGQAVYAACVATYTIEEGKNGVLTIKERTSVPTDGGSFHSLGLLQPLEKGAEVGKIAGQYFTLSFSTAPPDESEPNITVTYTAETTASNAAVIEQAAFGTVYGVNGNLDRLFLGGNPKHAATVVYSAMDDFTYFPDVNTVSVGVSSVPITAFARLADGALAVFKEQSSHDASLFTLGGTYTSTEDENGVTTSFSALFPKSAGAEGECALTAYACANLAGDTLLLSKNGVFGVELQEDVMTTVRYTRERSRSIAEKLKGHENLADAVATVYDGRYYLAIDGVCYIADARHKYTADASDGSFNYEWWYWDNIPARVWTELGGKLAFGSKDGRVCVFDGEYTDRTYLHTASGDLSLDITEGGRLTCKTTLYGSIENGAEIVVNNERLYALVEESATVANDRISTANENGIFSFYEGMQVYSSGLVSDGLYTVTNIDFGEGTYSLKDENGNLVTQTETTFSLYRSLSGETLFIEKENENVYLKEAKEGKRLRLVAYKNGTPIEILATVKISAPVVAEWVTPVFDLGTNAYSKTLLKMTVATAPETHGKLSFGYETRNARMLLDKRGGDRFSFEDFSFNAFSFDTGFANSYSVRCNERNFNYILFRFLSDDDGDCAVSDFSVVYKINRENKGVR